jgi:hypothetical protein
MAESSASGESSSSKSLMFMTIAVFLGLSCLLGGGLFFANRVVRSIGLVASTSRDTIHTPGGSYRIEKQNDVGPGLPVYPNTEMVLPTEKTAAAALQARKSGITSVTYQTPDTRDEVQDWYIKHLGREFTRHEAGETPLPEVFRNVRISDTAVAFLAERGQQVRIVSLSVSPKGTSISLFRFTKSAVQ